MCSALLHNISAKLPAQTPNIFTTRQMFVIIKGISWPQYCTEVKCINENTTCLYLSVLACTGIVCCAIKSISVADDPSGETDCTIEMQTLN